MILIVQQHHDAALYIIFMDVENLYIGVPAALLLILITFPTLVIMLALNFSNEAFGLLFLSRTLDGDI